MKNVVECYKDFFGYFNAVETHESTNPVFINFSHQNFFELLKGAKKTCLWTKGFFDQYFFRKIGEQNW